MRTATVAVLLVLFGLAASESALANKVLPPGANTGGGHRGGDHHGGGHHHGHYHHSTFVGVGFGWGPWWYPPAYYYPYPVPVEYSVQPVYVEQRSAPAAEPAWWYYCDAARAYYPHVKACPAGWQRVPPTPPQ